MPSQPTRRQFLKRSAAAAGGGWVVWSAPAVLATMDLACTNRAAGRGFSALSAADAVEVEELCALIVPTDDLGPGAREAGVIWYIDASLERGDDDDRAEFSAAVADMLGKLREAYPGRTSLTELTSDERVAFATSIQATDFFDDVRDATVTGMFADPRHGGNRDKIGWAVLGFDDRHVWHPPFGHYDAPYHANDTSGT